MKQNLINQTHIEGYFYDHKLEKKVTGPTSKNPGVEYIRGVVHIATDEKLLNVIPLYFRYTTAVTSKGNANATYAVLEKLLEEEQSVVKVGKEKALKLRADSSIRLNEWYQNLTDEKPISVARNEGGFIHIIPELNENEKQRNTFKTDMLITSVTDVEADPTQNIEAHVNVRGAIFVDYNKTLLPMSFVVRNTNGMQYFMGLAPTNKEPVFTCVWGRQLSQVVKTETVTESAFGEAEVVSKESTTREFVITGASKEPYPFEDEDFLTKEEVNKMMSDRALYLATIKKNQEEYQKNRADAVNSAATVSAEDNYDF